MPNAKRTHTYLIQLRADGSPGLYGRVQVLGKTDAIRFSGARQLVEALRRLLADSATEARADEEYGRRIDSGA